MTSHAFLKLEEYLKGGCFFSHTKIENAEIRLKERLKQNPSKVSVAVFGDDQIRHPALVCKAIIAILNRVGNKDQLAMVSGNRNRCDKVIQNFAEKSNIESYVICQNTDENWRSDLTPFQEMVDNIINLSDIVIIFTSSLNEPKSLRYIYDTAVDDGCFVTKRYLRGG